MTLGELIEAATAAKAASPLGGNTCIYLCLTDSELEYATIENAELERDDHGAIFRVDVPIPVIF